jgi:hypothetical protein
VILIEEFTRAGVQVIFLNRPIGDTPEDTLLLQLQGMFAGNCSTHPFISKYLIHNDSFGRYAAAQHQRRFRCSVEAKY